MRRRRGNRVSPVGIEFGAPLDIDHEAAVMAEEVEEGGAGEAVGGNFDGLKGQHADGCFKCKN
jgi:hypothetical protein